MTTTTTLERVERLPDRTPPADLDRLIIEWMTSLRSEQTRAAYRRDLRTFEEYCDAGGVSLTLVTRAHLNLWARLLETRYAASTVVRKLAAVSSFYDYLETEGYVSDNPVTKVTRPRVCADDQQVTTARTRAELEAVLEVATEPRDRALVLVLALMGLRVSEALGLDLDGLETDRGHRTAVIHGKGNRRTRAAVPPPVIEALERVEEVEGRTSGPVFARDGVRWNRYQANRALRRLGRAAGLTGDLRPHQLRATAITLALELGAPLHEVQTFARHASPLTTRRYDANRLSLDRSPAYLLAASLA